ncbi:hypothetical protein EVAR_89676_1 [Eumeta japonica]|uniref:Uncharacterized protein n=1 Tax=Eumeta variegata TaxID=151549 RepID=A0A4C1YC05_EUMVA|nr:hypothetical protein EVAR_89676_1 [Eumeta japonica]
MGKVVYGERVLRVTSLDFIFTSAHAVAATLSSARARPQRNRKLGRAMAWSIWPQHEDVPTRPVMYLTVID